MFKYIREHQLTGVVVVVALFAVAGVITWMSLPSSPKKATKGFFTVDEGKTWFIDDVKRITPFDKDGKPAVRAYLFRCPGESLYCGLLSRHTDGARKKVEASKGRSPDEQVSGNMLEMGSREFKKPGQAAWVNEQTGAIFQVTAQKNCSNGTYPESSLP